MPIRPVVAGSFLLQIEGESCGSLRSFEGGGATADVIEEPGPDSFSRKHLGPVRYDPITVEVGFSMGRPLHDWIGGWLQGAAQSRNGAIVLADAKLQARSELQFADARLTEVGIPACDGASKDIGYLTVAFAPERTQSVKGSGRITTRTYQKQKAWVSSNFRLEIDGLDCSRVAKVDAFSIGRSATPGALDFPNLRIAFAESSVETWRQWHEDFVVVGKNDDSQEKRGTLTLFSANLQETLLTVTFSNLGIFRLDRESSAASTDRVSLVIAELYCERIELNFG